MSYNETTACSNPDSIGNNPAMLLLSDRGLTLVELIIVTVLIGVLTMLSLPALNEMKLLTQKARAATELREIEKTIIAFAIDRGGGFPNNLALIKLNGARDPWGHPYEYHPVAHRLDGFLPINADFDLYSVGPDGQSDASLNHASSADDVIRAGDGGFIGTVDDYNP